MKFTATPLDGLTLVDLEPIQDSRGFFAVTFGRDVFADRGLDAAVVQCNLSSNRLRGTLRGLHYQVAPMEEAKYVRCLRGAIHDVVVDLRSGSPTLHRHFAVELSAANRRALFIPAGFAHGFQTLEDETEVWYQTSQAYSPDHARILRYDDPRFGIPWPLPVSAISDRDAGASAG